MPGPMIHIFCVNYRSPLLARKLSNFGMLFIDWRYLTFCCVFLCVSLGGSRQKDISNFFSRRQSDLPKNVASAKLDCQNHKQIRKFMQVPGNINHLPPAMRYFTDQGQRSVHCLDCFGASETMRPHFGCSISQYFRICLNIHINYIV